MLELENISFRYPKKDCFALSIPTLSIPPGEIFTLLGPNGSGKTTLLRIASGLIQPASGEVSICHHSMITDEFKAKAHVGLVLGEERSFYYRLSGERNLEFFGGLYGIPRSVLRQRIQNLLAVVGLTKDAKSQYMRYSSGMKKRLALARAMLHDPRVLLLDEPNSGIDPPSARSIRTVIEDLRDRGTTIVMTTHDMAEAERLSSRIGFLRDGKIIKIGTADQYRAMIQTKRLEVTFDRGSATLSSADLEPLASRIQMRTRCDSISVTSAGIAILYNGSLDVRSVLLELGNSELTVERVNIYTGSLEDVFIKLMES
jgi:ABC-2 type transport system ATP-binding protein